jgi:site-specific DNA-methyltransferase (adenine-specific)
VALLEELIGTFTHPGDVVLDPVIGGGATAVAAGNLGRRFIGIEQDPQNAAAARLRATGALPPTGTLAA